jgi:small subunit ribosomal protein S6
MLFIVHPNYEQDRLDAVISAVQKEISSKGAKILKTDNWGKRKLAYLINKQRYGSYVLMYFEADPEMIEGLYEWMEIQAQILHQMVIRLEEKPELTEESQNPDSPHAGKPSEKAKEDKADAKGASEDDEEEEDVEEEAEETEVEEPVEEAPASAEATVDEPAEDVEEEVAESASAEATADVSEVAEEATEEVKEGE